MIMADNRITAGPFGANGGEQRRRIDFEAVRWAFRDIFGRFRAFDTVFLAE